MLCVGIISIIDDSNNATFDKNTSKKICRPQNNDDCLVMQPRYPNISINKPIMNWNLLRQRIIGLNNMGDNSCYIRNYLFRKF